MKRILHLISSIQGPASYSIKLGKAVVEKIMDKYPGSSVEEVNLNDLDLPHLNLNLLQSMFTPGEQLTPEDRESLRYSDDAIRQLMDADIIVIGAPLYNFTIHTALKAWLDLITRAGITFSYNEQGPIGLVQGKKVYVAMSSGGVYSEGPGQSNDFVAPYLQSFLGFLGMTEVKVFRAEGVKIEGIREHALEKGIESISID